MNYLMINQKQFLCAFLVRSFTFVAKFTLVTTLMTIQGRLPRKLVCACEALKGLSSCVDSKVSSQELLTGECHRTRLALVYLTFVNN